MDRYLAIRSATGPGGNERPAPTGKLLVGNGLASLLPGRSTENIASSPKGRVGRAWSNERYFVLVQYLQKSVLAWVIIKCGYKTTEYYLGTRYSIVVP